MTKFGLLWRDGRGARDVAAQKDWLADEGVNEKRMAFDAPPGRPGSTTYACYIAAFGHDPEGKKRRSIRFAADEFVKYTLDGGRLHVLEMDRDYQGVEGFRDFIFDWLDRAYKQQTSAARKAKRAKPKREWPKWYERLTPPQRRLFARDFQGTRYQSVDLMAHAYGTSRAGIYRVTRKLKITRPGYLED